MFGLPSAYYLDDALRQHREAASRRTSAATFPASASKSVPVSRIPSRATSRRPSLAGLEEPSETSKIGAATGSTIPRNAEDFVDVIARSFSSFLAPTVKSQPPAPPGLKEEQISKASTSPSPGKGKGKARATDEDQDVQDATSEDRNSGPSSRRVSRTADRNVASEKDILSQTKATLLFCKSQVFVHPSKKRDDNISGYLGLASVRSSQDDAEGSIHMTGSDERRIVIFWIPSSLAEALDEEQSYRLVSDRADKVVKGMAADHKDQSTSEVSTSHDVDEGYIVITLPIAATSGQAGSSPVEGIESRCFSPSPSLSSKSSLHRPSANSIKDYPSINADNNDNSRTDASSLLLVSEGGDLMRNEFTADGERQRDQSGGESARKMEEQRRHREMDYAWSVPLEEVYSLLVYQPNIGSWYGSITINLLGGVSMPSLYFHDEESPTALEILKTSRSSASLASTLSTVNSTPNSVASPKVPWGATPLFSALRGHADILRSRLEPRLFLVNPSRADREVHEIDLGSSVENDRAVPRARTSGSDSTVSSGARAYPPRATFPDAAKNAYSNSGDDFPAATFLHPTRTQLLSGFSQLTQKAKKITQDILSQPFAEPIVTHLPAPVRDLVQPGQAWESKKNNGRNVAGEFESARVYLARWARVVAEEGERSRKAELAATARISSGGHRSESEAKSDLGIFELVRNNRSDGQVPNTTRTPGNPVTLEEVLEWHANGFDESHLRKETFRRGVEAGEARQLVWEVLLGVIDWKLGLGQETKEAQAKWNTLRDQQSVEYYDLQNKWQNSSHQGDDKEREEWHRIDVSSVQSISDFLFKFSRCDDLPYNLNNESKQVDCRRTDRNQPMFAIPDALKGEEEKEGGGAARSSGSIPLHVEEGSQTALNPHVAALRTILMTYHAYSPDLGYVQGMSDLLSPIYVVYEGDESRSFWVFCGWMKTMDVNFLRDQSGMKQKLSTLQQLISVMDPQLYRKLERTNCTSMFICFRWLLIAFKREFKFGEVIKLWDVLFARYYSDSFDQFIALAILHSHREVIIRYLVEFDEVLKYANDLSETIDLQSTMAQAEVLFLSFRGLVEEIDRNEIVRAGTAQEEAGHVRSRRSSVSTIASEPKRDLVSDELRELLLNAGSKNNL